MKVKRLIYKPTFIYLIFLSMMYTISGNCYSQGSEKDKYKLLRTEMVQTQIKDRGIKNTTVINAMLKVPRHLFVPAEFIDQAYEDHPVSIGEGQTISQPYIVALMTEVLDLDKTSKVLEIGTGSGYQAAILSEIVDKVYTIEVSETLGSKAAKLLDSLGYANVKVKIGDGYQGWEEFSPFDAIIVTCAPSHIPQPLKDQLKDGGTMIIPVGEQNSQELVLLKKKNGKLKKREIIPVRFVPMIDEGGNKY